MAIPERPDGRVENYLANLIGQETAWEPGNPESRVEEYLDYILENGTKTEQEMEDDIAALKSIGRYLSLWNAATGLPVTNPKKLPYTYKTGDYYIVSNVDTTTNYMPSGIKYEGTASVTTDSGVKVNDYYVFDGTTWSRLAHSGGGGGLPQIVNGDAGKALMVKNDETGGSWENPYFEQSYSVLYNGTLTFTNAGGEYVASPITGLSLEHTDVIVQFDSDDPVLVPWNEEEEMWATEDMSVILNDDNGGVIGSNYLTAASHSVKISGESKSVRSEFVSALERSIPTLVVTETSANTYTWNGSDEEYTRYVKLLKKSVPVTVIIKCLNEAIYSAPLQLAYGDVGSDTYLLAVVTSLKETPNGGGFAVSLVHDSYTLNSDGSVITWTDRI